MLQNLKNDKLSIHGVVVLILPTGYTLEIQVDLPTIEDRVYENENID